MKAFYFLKKNVKLVSISFFLITILIILAAIFYLDRSNDKLSSVGLSGYNDLKKEITLLSSKNSKLGSDKNYQKMLDQLINKLENKNLSKEEKYNDLLGAATYLVFAYTSTNDPDLYTLEAHLNNFIITNYPDKNYPNKKPACFDPECAQNPSPKEILAVIEEIKNSSIPDYLKENDIKNLKNYIYLNDDTSQLKVNNFMLSAEDIKNNKEYKNAGINIKLYDEIVSYVKNNYLKEYDIYQKGQ